MAASSSGKAKLSTFRKALLMISKKLSEEDVDTLKYLCRDHLSESDLERVKKGYHLFNCLDKRGNISEQEFDFVIELLQSIDQEALVTTFRKEMGLGPQNRRNRTPSLGNSSQQVRQDLKLPHAYPHFSPPPTSTKCSPGLFEGIPKPNRSLPEGPASSVDQSDTMKGIYNVDGTPIVTSGNSKSVPESIARSSSLQTAPSAWQSPGGPLYLNTGAPSFSTTRSSAQFQKMAPSLSGSSGSGPKMQMYGSVTPGGNVEASMGKLSLEDAGQSKEASNSLKLAEHDLVTDSPMQVKPVAGTGSGSRSHPREVSSLHQGQGSESWRVFDQSLGSPTNTSQARELRQPCGISTPHHDQGSISEPLLDLATDSPRVTERGAGARRPLVMASPQQGQQSASGPLVDLTTDAPNGTDRQARQGRCTPKVPLDETVRCIDQMFAQHDTREEDRAADRVQPKLRAYQRELAERPLDEFHNYIICAPTGSGKTLTAAYICHEYQTWFKTNEKNKYFKALFIVNMRHLTLQQRDAFQSYFLDKQAVQTIGEQQSLTEALKMDEAMPAVLMLTAQIFVNALKSGKVDIKDLDMLIFDECHHTDLKHPYNEIMKTYLKQKQKLPRPQRVGVSGRRLPFIIGLSASLGVGSEALSHLLTLCGNMDSKGVVRVLRNEEELLQHVNAPEEDSIELASKRADSDKQFADLLEALMIQIEDQDPDIEEHPLPPRGCQVFEAEVMRRLTDAQKLGNRTAVIVYMYLYEYNRALMLYDDLRAADGLAHLEMFHRRRRLIASQEQVPVEEYCQGLFNRNLRELNRLAHSEDEHSNEKLGKLAILLNKIFTDNPESKGIVLVRMKVATTAVADFLKKSTLLQTLPCRVIPQRFVGQGDIEDGCLTEAQQKAVLKNFRKEDGCNVLVATDIAQEGLDMPACNFVIRYNFVSNEIGTVQSKGRARAKGSQCYLIVESGSVNERRELENRYKVQKMKDAMEELEAMTEDQRLDKITERQIEILEKIRRAEEQAELQAAMFNLDRITVHCKECSALVCKASELRRMGDAGHVTCISPNFKRWVKEIKYNRPQRFRDTETVGLIKCGTYDCGNQLGTMQNFLNLSPPEGYALKAQSFMIQFETGGVKTPKMWKKAGFQILKTPNS